jgi:Flp pilus assembly protein TadG
VPRQHPSGQALAEFALVLPLLLALIVGGAGVGILLIHRSQLQHVAQEIATEAASQNCDEALTKVDAILGYHPDAASCDTTGQIVTVQVVHGFEPLVPFLPDTIHVEARAILR